MTEQDAYAQSLRTIAEKFRELDYIVKDAVTKWDDTMATTIGDNPTKIDEERTDEGVPGIAGDDVHAFVAKLKAFLNMTDAAGVRSLVRRFCVRALRVD